MENGLCGSDSTLVTIRLIKSGQVVAIAQATDIASQRMKVRNPGIALNSGDSITVKFSKKGHPRPVCFNAPASVVHIDESNIGLRFDRSIPMPEILGLSNLAAANLN